MHVRAGFELVYDCAQPTPMILVLRIHQAHIARIIVQDRLRSDPALPVETYRDGFGNLCSRIVAPEGRTRLYSDAIVACSDEPDVIDETARQLPVEALPSETLVYLMGSRYCETDCLSQAAWDLFGAAPEGWARVQAICDYVHHKTTFDYKRSSPTKSACGTLEEGAGVCRDFAHLAISFCRCMNIPARYCTGYLGDIRVPPSDDPMDFAAWMEVYLGGRWYTFDPRNNTPRYGRVLLARGRDAADVPISNSFGDSRLEGFKVWTDEMAFPYIAKQNA